ncbi:uncharacterized protein TRIADDRAFT_54151 [Trichoplax adhaerens]|uniref:G-protein coupled receptors family 1 profile domain-containing protein n=1 Tax=Trichoplax adhaerens TaxID=10228 RepID=B3RR91_TRIAD|nr:hypothetical protein TRIADDRAFT_54151 [Trichoplax adhaerens]EDV26303.1 hypothetical protein TRIADDRAFT_54151 [Trichoplax adhaerens]|eukprot:XP_002110299.1 hypothetical protein TRIADDRAFT_54151 [Trichoplax adhaerens]
MTLTELSEFMGRGTSYLMMMHIKDNGLKELNYANRTRYDNNVVLELDVSGNKMNNFFSSIEARLVSLEKLLLQGNNLAYVSGKSFYGPPEMVTVLTKRDYLCCMVPAKIKLCQPSMGSDDLSSCENLLSHFSQKLFIWIVGILAVVGNLLVFIQNHSIRKQKNSLVPIFLINSLALSDLLMAFYLIIIIVADLAFSTGEYGLNSEIWLSSPFCLIACFLVNASSLTTVLLMVTICSDRYICLVYPLSPKRMSIKTARIVVVFVWILSLSFAAAPVISSANMPGYLRLYTYNSMCMANNYQIDYYRVWMISYLSIIFIAWVAMTILYMRLFMTIRRSGKNLRRSTATDNTVIAIRLALILISDLISWVPFYYVNLHGLLTSGRVDVIALQFVGIFSLPINSAINPYLYTFTNIDIIKKFLVRQKTFSTKS